MFENMFLFVYIHVQHCEQCIFWIIHTIPEIETKKFTSTVPFLVILV